MFEHPEKRYAISITQWELNIILWALSQETDSTWTADMTKKEYMEVYNTLRLITNSNTVRGVTLGT